MMEATTIWRTQLRAGPGVETIELPIGAKIIDVRWFKGAPQIWYEFAEATHGIARPRMGLRVWTIPTGSGPIEEMTYLGSYVIPGADEIYFIYKLGFAIENKFTEVNMDNLHVFGNNHIKK